MDCKYISPPTTESSPQVKHKSTNGEALTKGKSHQTSKSKPSSNTKPSYTLSSNPGSIYYELYRQVPIINFLIGASLRNWDQISLVEFSVLVRWWHFLSFLDSDTKSTSTLNNELVRMCHLSRFFLI